VHPNVLDIDIAARGEGERGAGEEMGEGGSGSHCEEPALEAIWRRPRFKGVAARGIDGEKVRRRLGERG
jgi:hypothetical protein